MKKQFILLVFTLLSIAKLMGQENIGINTATPDASAILEIMASDKGLLIPRMSTSNRMEIENPALSLLVFDTDLNAFYFHNGTEWTVLDADENTTDELLTAMSLAGTTLSITDAGGTQTVDLSALQDGVDDADASPTNELITGASLSGTTLSITDAGGTQTVDLSTLQDSVDVSLLLPAGTGGDILYHDGTEWQELPKGNNGQILTLNDGLPVWADNCPPIEIGDFYAGGLVFYIDATGCHGLVAAPSDHGTEVPWGCPNKSIVGAYPTAVGTGAQNTIYIETACSTVGTAADICANLSLDGYDDWFLPSKDELDLMYTNLYLNGLGDFASFPYFWSSSAGSNSYAFMLDFVTNTPYMASKASSLNVWPARAF